MLAPSTDPTADELLASFDGRIYAATGPGTVALDTRSLGWSALAPSVTLKFLVGSRKDDVIVESTVRDGSPRPDRELFYLIMDVAVRRRPTFPFVVERARMRVPVDGRERVFAIYSAAGAAVAKATIRGVQVLVRCRTSRLRTLELGVIDASDLDRVRRDMERSLSRRRADPS